MNTRAKKSMIVIVLLLYAGFLIGITLNGYIIFICDLDVIFTHAGMSMDIYQEGGYYAGIQCKILPNTHPNHYPDPEEIKETT